MHIRSLVIASGIGLILLLVVGDAAESAELNVLCANGMQSVLEDLAPKFERATGHRLVVAFDTGGATVKRARDGEQADVVIASRQGIDALVKDGKTAADTVTALASTGISVAIRKGAPRIDISSPEALKRTLLAAKSITYLNPEEGGASGIHFARVLNRLGIATEMKPKTVFAPKASVVGAMVANGEAEIGVIQYQFLFSVPGIEIAGPLPGDLQDTTVFSAAVMVDAGSREASRALITFFRSPEGAAVIREKGMEPGAP